MTISYPKKSARINDINDAKYFHYLKDMVIKKLMKAILKALSQHKRPPSIIKITVDNCVIPDVVIKSAFMSVNKTIRQMYRLFPPIRFKLLLESHIK